MENQIIEIIKKHINVKLIYLFGSVITERFNNESDIDIAIVADKILTGEMIYNIKMDLINSLNREIDLIDMNNCSLTVNKEIIYKGKNIYKIDDKFRSEFEYKNVVMFNQYREDIDVIIKKIKERGRIYE